MHASYQRMRDIVHPIASSNGLRPYDVARKYGFYDIAWYLRQEHPLHTDYLPPSQACAIRKFLFGLNRSHHLLLKI